MLNKDNNITVGHMTKQSMRAALNNFLVAWSTNQPWTQEDTQVLVGELGYLKHIEPDYFQHMLDKAEHKSGYQFKLVVKQILNS